MENTKRLIVKSTAFILFTSHLYIKLCYTELSCQFKNNDA